MKMNKIPCEVIQDLFPSYIDGLTSEKTTAHIDEHLASCEECTKVLRSMRGDAEKELIPGEEDKKEVDFLKKTRRMQKAALFCVLATIVLAVVFIIVRILIVGSSYDGTLYAIDKIAVEDGILHIKASTTDSENVLSRMKFSEENGVVSIKANLVPVSFLNPAGKEFTYELKDPASLKQVKIGSQVVWDDGEKISPLTSLVYASRHNYIGDMPANGKSANALGVSSRIGAYENSLQTAQEPYGWTMILKDDVPSGKEVLMESDMESMAYVLIAVIGNLDHISYEYTVDGIPHSLCVTAAAADSFFGRSIKDCGKSARLLNELIQKTGF